MNEMNLGKLSVYGMFTCVCTYLGLGQEALVILAILIVIDCITGVGKSLSLGHEIRSRIGIVGVLSKLLLLLIPVTIALVGKGAGMDLIFLVTSSTSLLVVFEGYSIIGNLTSMITGKDYTEQDSLSAILSLILGIIKTLLDKLMNGFKD